MSNSEGPTTIPPLTTRREWLQQAVASAFTSRALAKVVLEGQKQEKAPSPDMEKVLEKVQPRLDPEKFFPGLEGEVRFVETLDPKDWQKALSKPGPAIIVPLVGGVVDLKGSTLRITGGNISVLGQFAEPPLTFTHGQVVIQASDVRLDHISVLPGDRSSSEEANKGAWEPDGITIMGADGPNKPASQRVLISNSTLKYAVDENASVTGKIRNGFEGAPSDILFYRCLMARALHHSTHSKGSHGCGFLAFDFAQRIGLVECVFSDNPYRNPMIKGNVSALIDKCLVVNPGEQIVKLQPVLAEYTKEGKEDLFAAPTVVARNGIFIRGLDTPASRDVFETLKEFDGTVTVYVDGNTLFDKPDMRLSDPHQVTANSKTKLQPFGERGLTPKTTIEAVAQVTSLLNNVGAQPAKRDPQTQKLIEDILAGKGRFIDSQEDMGGYPKVEASSPIKVIFPSDSEGRLRVIQSASTKAMKKE